MSRLVRSLNPSHWLYIFANVTCIVGGFALYSIGTPLFTAIGSSVVATGLAGELVFVYVFITQQEYQRRSSLRNLGMLEGFSTRGISIKSYYSERLQHVSRNIDILGFGLRSLREDYFQQFSAWKAQAHVRILLLDPEFPLDQCTYADQRDKEEHNTPGTINNDVRRFVGELRSIISSGEFEIRLYKCIPSVTIFRIDDNLFWGPYLIEEQSRNTPVFLIESGGLFNDFMDHFDKIWQSNVFSRNVPATW